MNDTVKWIVAGVAAVAYLGMITALAWHGSITGSEALGAAGAVVLPIVGVIAHSSGVSTGADAAKGSQS